MVGRRRVGCCGIVAAALGAIVASISGVILIAQSPNQGVRRSDVVVSIPVGPGGIVYKGGGTTESEQWGPSALRIAADGSFLIADPVESRIFRFRADGAPLAPINVQNVVSVTDVASDGVDLAVLDASADPPKVLRLRMDGVLAETIPLPDEMKQMAMTGIHLDSRQIVIETGGGSQTATLEGQRHRGALVSGDIYSVVTPDLNDPQANHSVGALQVGQRRITVQVDKILGAMSVLGAAPNGDVFVLVEELSDTNTIRVDQVVRRYDASGKLTGLARVPLAERQTYVQNGVALGPNGDIFALVTRKDSVDIVRLRIARTLGSILPNRDDRKATAVDASDLADAPTMSALAATACRSAADMFTTASGYTGNQMFLTTKNLSGTCVGRGKPRYLGTTAATYGSVSYDWAGWDTVADFNSAMSSGLQAGDIDTTTIEACSRGVDCSGFVSRAWNTARYTTSTLPSISLAVSQSQLVKGDIINRVNDHVAMFDRFASNGVYTVEATTYNSYDRVVALYNGWGRFSGYSYWRNKNVCTLTLISTSPSTIYAKPGYDQTIYVNGTALANTSVVYVQFPNGGYAYLYPPAQVFSRSTNQLGLKITFGTTGQYYLRAYTPEGGWSNALPVSAR